VLYPEINADDGNIITISDVDSTTSMTAVKGGKVLVRQGRHEVVLPVRTAVLLIMGAASILSKRQNTISATTGWSEHSVEEVVV